MQTIEAINLNVDDVLSGGDTVKILQPVGGEEGITGVKATIQPEGGGDTYERTFGVDEAVEVDRPEGD